MSQKTVQTITIGSQSFAIPSGTKLADLLSLIGLQAIRSTYCSNPWKTFDYVSDGSTQIAFGAQLVFENESAAENAKKAFALEHEKKREVLTLGD
jgi:hypothetical protein